MTKEKIEKIFNALNLAIPKPTTELNYKSTFELLIAVILSARTTDKTVNKITKNLFPLANTPKKILTLGIAPLKKLIKSSGFFQNKAKNIIATCKILQEKFKGRVPASRSKLETLPGVGRKTANVVLNIAFDQPTIAVDTHVFRVAKRLELAKGKTPKAIEEELSKIIPEKFIRTAGNLLLLHGRYTCRSQKPKCTICPIKQFCPYKFKNLKAVNYLTNSIISHVSDT